MGKGAQRRAHRSTHIEQLSRSGLDSGGHVAVLLCPPYLKCPAYVKYEKIKKVSSPRFSGPDRGGETRNTTLQSQQDYVNLLQNKSNKKLN